MKEKNELILPVKVDMSEVDELIHKAERLNELLKEANSLVKELASNSLGKIHTRDLVEELKTREGVEATYVEPYQTKESSVNGPACILAVID